jgi:hypothetical protein
VKIIQISSLKRSEQNSTSQIKQIQNNKSILAKIENASKQIQKLNEVKVENASTLIKYRQNITVPAVWVPIQGVRAANLGIIPPEKIPGLNTYIQANLNIDVIDGGDLDNQI